MFNSCREIISSLPAFLSSKSTPAVSALTTAQFGEKISALNNGEPPMGGYTGSNAARISYCLFKRSKTAGESMASVPALNIP